MKQERIEELLKGTRYLEPTNCDCSARSENECGCENANWFTWGEREMAARVQLLAKALVNIKAGYSLVFKSENVRQQTLLELWKDVDAALAEAGITQEKVG
jgi:hypothetical protein